MLTWLTGVLKLLVKIVVSYAWSRQTQKASQALRSFCPLSFVSHTPKHTEPWADLIHTYLGAYDYEWMWEIGVNEYKWLKSVSFLKNISILFHSLELYSTDSYTFKAAIY